MLLKRFRYLFKCILPKDDNLSGLVVNEADTKVEALSTERQPCDMVKLPPPYRALQRKAHHDVAHHGVAHHEVACQYVEDEQPEWRELDYSHRVSIYHYNLPLHMVRATDVLPSQEVG